MDVITLIAVLILILPAAGALLSALLKGRTRPAAVAITASATGLAAWLTFSTFHAGLKAGATFGASYTRMLGGFPGCAALSMHPSSGFLSIPWLP